MKRVLTATCLAAVCAVGLGAQQTTTATQEPQQAQGAGRGGPRTVTGCLRAGDTAGTYMLTDIQMARPTDTTGSTAGSTAGAAATGSTAVGTGTTGEGQRPGQMPTSIMLSPGADVDLKAHVGHKIEVTGTMAGGGRPGGGDVTAGAATTTNPPPPPPPPPPVTTTGAGATTTGGGQTAGGSTRVRTLNVTSVRMISESCS